MYTYFDAETTTEPPIQVWCWLSKNTDNVVEKGTTVKSLCNHFISKSQSVKKIAKKGNKNIFYCFNEKFDGKFILDYLLKNGFVALTTGETPRKNTISTIITQMGLFYSIKIYTEQVYRGETFLASIEIKDAFHLLDKSIAEHGEALNMPKGKTPLYKKVPGFISKKNWEYVLRDVDILKTQHQNYRKAGLKKDTQAGCALTEYKKIIGTKIFKKIFPQLSTDFSLAYRGGVTICSPLIKDKELYNLFHNDINSTYPYQMKNRYLPYGTPTEIKGFVSKPKDKVIIYFGSLNFTVKPRHFPSLRIPSQNKIKYPKTYDGETMLTHVDLELLKKVADVKFDCYKSYVFNQSNKMFAEFVDKFHKMKSNAKNNIEETKSKMMLNSLYGKFGTKPENCLKLPYLNTKKNLISYHNYTGEEKNVIYPPVAIFITAYAREHLFTPMFDIGFDNCHYCDTDSIFSSVPLPDKYMSTSKELGKWEDETKGYKVKKATFYGTKQYKKIVPTKDKKTHKIKNKTSIVCVGLPRKTAKKTTYNKFIKNTPIPCQKSKTVDGGVQIYGTEFELKDEKSFMSLEEFIS